MAARTRAMSAQDVRVRRDDARSFLETAPDTAPGVNLKRLVDEKTNYQYSSARVTLAGTRRLITALERLVEKMDAVLQG